jgi:hypothetical protein
MKQRPLVLNNGKISQLPVGDTIFGLVSPESTKLNYHIDALAAFDRVVSIDYYDFGLRNQRIKKMVCSSLVYPSSNLEKNVFWLDVGSKNQRIDKIEFVSSVFGIQALRKVFFYLVSGTGYAVSDFSFELF